MDADSCRVVKLDEILTYFHITKTALTEKIFEDKTSKYSSYLTFEQFAVTTWKFLTVNLDKLPAFAFDLLDSKNTGILSQEKIKLLVELIHNKNYDECGAVRKLVKKSEMIHGSSPVAKDAFTLFSERHRALCDPLRRMQISFQAKLLGRVVWKRIRLAREASSLEQNAEHQGMADKIVEIHTVDRRLNSSLVALDERQAALEVVMEQMRGDSPLEGREEAAAAAAASNKEIRRLAAEEESNRRCVVIPPDSRLRVPKSASLHRTPRLIPLDTGAPKASRKKRRRTFGRRPSSMSSSYREGEKKFGSGVGGHIRRYSMEEGSSSPAASKMKNFISDEVQMFASTSHDGFGDDDGEEDRGNRILDTVHLVQDYKGKSIKESAVLPF